MENKDWRIELARSGDPTLYIGGKAVHSKFNPVKEAERAAELIPSGTGIVVLAGLGLGYVAEAIVRQKKGRFLVIAEADEAALQKVNQVRDVRPLLQHPEVSLILGGAPEDIRYTLKGGPVGASIYFLPWRAAMAKSREWYRKLECIVKDTAQRRKVNAHTLERFGNLWIRNLAANCSILPDAISVEDVKDCFFDVPALVLAGGPSLDDVLPHLEPLSRRFLLIAVDTALPAVLRCGIVPDIVAAVDPQYWNIRHFDYCEIRGTQPLILAESATHPGIFQRLRGRVIMMRSNFPLGSILEDAVGLRGNLKAGGSVSTAAWDFARHLACKPMLIAGLDMGFPGKRTHYKGSLSHVRPHLLSKRLQPAQDMMFHALMDMQPHMVSNMAGLPILTDQRMDVYHAWFSESVENLKEQIPGVLGTKGRFIRGMKVFTVQELLAYPECRESINVHLEHIRALPASPNAGENMEAVLRQLTEALIRLRELAVRGMDAALKARENSFSRDFQEEQISVMADIDKAILGGDGLETISFLMQPIILEITTLNSASQADPLEMSQRIYTQMAQSASYHLRYLSQVERLQ